jgi:hypothetical protein
MELMLGELVLSMVANLALIRMGPAPAREPFPGTACQDVPPSREDSNDSVLWVPVWETVVRLDQAIRSVGEIVSVVSVP